MCHCIICTNGKKSLSNNYKNLPLFTPVRSFEQTKLHGNELAEGAYYKVIPFKRCKTLSNTMNYSFDTIDLA